MYVIDNCIMFIDKENIDTEFIIKSLKKLNFIKNYEFEILSGGSRSVALLVDGYVVRFPKTKEALESQEREALILEKVYGFMPSFVLSKTAQSKMCGEKSYQKAINGRILTTTDYQKMSQTQKEELAKEVALFFAAIHEMPLSLFEEVESSCKPYADDWNFTKKESWNYLKAKDCLLLRGINLDDYKTSFDDDDLVFCHNDLSGSNLLIDDNDAFKAIIDWGNAATMPRTNEFVPLYKISREFANLVIKYYNNYSNKKINIKEVDYKALSFIAFVMLENPNSWFADTMIKNFLFV